MNRGARSSSRRVLLLGATGTIGRAADQALRRRGHHVTRYLRPPADGSPREPPAAHGTGRPAVGTRFGGTDSSDEILREAFAGGQFDVVLSCMASRTGAPADAWAVDHLAHRHLLRAAERAGVEHFVLLSAICVQKPRLEFQRAKLAFEEELRASALAWSIVRPTAYFKSISGQVSRVMEGKPFLIFGDGRLNACKPIADEDLADFLVDCVEDPSLRNRILPIGGPGPALTPREQGELIFDLLDRPPRFRSIPVPVLNAVVGTASLLGRLIPPLAPKAELARIARYYATESMLHWDPHAGRYDADATPEYGERTLREHYRRMIAGEIGDDRGAHALI